jgi:hypothetical protein
MNKQLILPIVAFAALAIKHATGYEMAQAEINTITDAALAVITIAGFFMAPRKKV